MTFLEKLQVIERVDGLIRRKATGTADDLAAKIEVSRRCVYDIINVMKNMGAPIEYCTTRQSYYYEYECELMIGFMEKVRGGKNKNSELFFDSAIFLHNPLIPLQHNHDYRDILRTL